MEIINEIFGYPLGFIMWLIYKVIPNYGIAILLFTLVTKILLFPLSIKQQKGQAAMQAFQPKLAALQKKYANNKEKLQEEQMKLYSEEGVNPMGSCLPLLIQFPVLFGIIDVVYRPITHIMRASSDVIKNLVDQAVNVVLAAQQNNAAWAEAIKITTNADGVSRFQNSYQQQLFMIQAFKNSPESFTNVAPDLAQNISDFNMNLFGIFDLGANPSVAWPMILIPILAGLSQLLVTVYMQWHQKKVNPSQPNMGAMNIMLYGMPIFSVWIAFSLPAGVGFYWICQSVISFLQSILLNKMYTPEKVAELVEKDKLKKGKKKKKSSYMERLLAAQEEYNKQRTGTTEKTVETSGEEVSETKISKAVKKDVDSKVIAEARRRMAEKYGDNIDE